MINALEVSQVKDNVQNAQITPPFPEQKPLFLGVFSGNTLKYFAAVLMVCDHLHQFFFQGIPEADWLNWLGRPVKPIFLFLCAEGFYHIPHLASLRGGGNDKKQSSPV